MLLLLFAMIRSVVKFPVVEVAELLNRSRHRSSGDKSVGCAVNWVIVPKIAPREIINIGTADTLAEMEAKCIFHDNALSEIRRGNVTIKNKMNGIEKVIGPDNSAHTSSAPSSSADSTSAPISCEPFSSAHISSAHTSRASPTRVSAS